MSFDAALQFVLGWERGYSNHPKDPGGSTNLGITQKTLDTWRDHRPDWNLPAGVRALNRPAAAKIYRAGYWDGIQADEMPAPIALLAFDCAVNQGPGRAIRLLQSALGVEADGLIGPKTLAALRGASMPTLIREYAAERALAYEETGDWQTFGRGWMRRLFGAVIEAVRLSAGEAQE